MSTPEKQAYSRGYQAGVRIRDATRMEWDRQMQAVAARAERAEKAAGIGHCQDCSHWNQPPDCSWGYCNVPARNPGPPFGCWGQRDKSPIRISTSPMFGCVLFLARAPEAGQQQPADAGDVVG